MEGIAIAIHQGFGRRAVDIGDGSGRQIARISVGRLTGSKADIHVGRSGRNAGAGSIGLGLRGKGFKNGPSCEADRGNNASGGCGRDSENNEGMTRLKRSAKRTGLRRN